MDKVRINGRSSCNGNTGRVYILICIVEIIIGDKARRVNYWSMVNIRCTNNSGLGLLNLIKNELLRQNDFISIIICQYLISLFNYFRIFKNNFQLYDIYSFWCTTHLWKMMDFEKRDRCRKISIDYLLKIIFNYTIYNFWCIYFWKMMDFEKRDRCRKISIIDYLLKIIFDVRHIFGKWWILKREIDVEKYQSITY